MANSTTTTRQKKTETSEATETIETKEVETVIPKEVDVNQYIPVINGFHGVLIYKSSRTGEIFRWENYGDEQEIELLELRNAKSSSKGFFVNNWFMFNDEYKWVIDYLGMKQFYKDALDIEGFDDLFTLSPTALKDKLGKLSKGQLKSVAYRAAELINDGEIDSLKTISVLEECLGVELVEK